MSNRCVDAGQADKRMYELAGNIKLICGSKRYTFTQEIVSYV